MSSPGFLSPGGGGGATATSYGVHRFLDHPVIPAQAGILRYPHETMSEEPTSQITPDRDLHIVLVHPEIHWNTGNAGRTCLAAGAQLHLVEPLGFDLDDRRVRRAGLDYWPRVAPRVWSGWDELESELPALGEPFFFSAEGERDLWEVSFPERPVLVFGRESVGLPAELREAYRDRLLRLPMADPQLRSLNLSTAVAVALYEVVRQRQAGGR